MGFKGQTQARLHITVFQTPSGFLRANPSPLTSHLGQKMYFFLKFFDILNFFCYFFGIFFSLEEKNELPRIRQGATMAPRLGLQATIL